MPKDVYERARKKTNRTGLVHPADEPDITEVAPPYRRTRWGYALSELVGWCFTYAPWGGGWPLTMGFRKHLFRKNGTCRRCGKRRK